MSETEAERFVKAVLESGGSAFPSERAVPGGGTLTMSGMTLRDYFAAQAMPVVMDTMGTSDMPKNADPALLAESIATVVARWSYAMADAMLAARAPSPIKEE